MQQNFNPGLAIDGVLLTMFDTRINLARQVANDAREYFGPGVFRTVIPRNIRLAEAPSFGKPILLYDVQSVGAKSYLSVAQELLRRVEAMSAGGAHVSEARRLGRGLEALLGPVSKEQAEKEGSLRELPVTAIRPNPFQPRKRVDEEPLKELVAIDRGLGPAATGRGAPEGQRLRADRRRASLARRPAPRVGADSRRRRARWTIAPSSRSP